MPKNNPHNNPQTTCILLLLSSILWASPAPAQTQTDTLPRHPHQLPPQKTINQTKTFQIIGIGLPLIIQGTLLKNERKHFRDTRNEFFPTFNHHYDNYLQYLPAAVMLAMKTAGIQGRDTWGRMLTADIISVAILTTSVIALKNTTGILRPDGSNRHSFPSGHTATAFMTATMMHKEYGLTRSPWYSVGAYTIATATGISRVLNNKHWVSDVMVGAGIGILSTEIGYYLADLLLENKKTPRHQHPEKTITRQLKPSFFGLYLGINRVITTSYPKTPLSTSEAGTVGVEGAYFITPHLGIGARLTVASIPLSLNNTLQQQPLNLFAAYIGPHFSYPLVPRLLLGTKTLLGYTHTPKNKLTTTTLPATNGLAFGTGFSLTYVARPALGIKIFTDYNIHHPLVPSGKKIDQTYTFGGAINIIF